MAENTGTTNQTSTPPAGGDSGTTPPAPPEKPTRAEGPAKVPVPEGTTGILYEGQFYPADDDGEAEVPAAAAPHLERQARRREELEASRQRREDEIQVTVEGGAPKGRRGR